MHSIHIYIYICYVHIDILYVKQHELSWSCAASGQGSSPQMMAPGSSRYPRARQQHMFVTWHVQSMHTHNIQYIYIYISTFSTTVYIIYIYICCVFMNMYLLIEEFHGRNSRRWLDNVLFVLGFLVISTSISRVWEEVVFASESIKDRLLNRSCRPGDPSEIAIWMASKHGFPWHFRFHTSSHLINCVVPLTFCTVFGLEQKGKGRTKNTPNHDFKHNHTTSTFWSLYCNFVMTCSFSLLRKAIWTP